jgi:hypothetical protein
MNLPSHSPDILETAGQRTRRPKEPNGVAARALARWENEGGAAKPVSQMGHDRRVALAATEEHILRCLGAAMVLQWNDLPTDIQRKLFEHAISMGEPPRSPELKQGIARFLHTHKDDG